MKNETIAIIMPTYNGEKYIKNQINSIIKQQYTKWILYVRDDGSVDSTKEILAQYKTKLKEKIILIEDDLGNLGVNNNIFSILPYVKEEYIMFADQDDIWKRDKVLLTYQRMKQEEKENDIPILVHSESLIFRDNDKNFQSYSKMEFLNRNRVELCNLLQANVVQGSTIMFNRKLYDKIKEICWNRTYTFLYDQYIAVIAAIYGKIVYIDKPLMYYRQHGANSIGCQKYDVNWIRFLLSKDENVRAKFRYRNYLYINKSLAQTIKKVYSTELTEAQKREIDIMLNSPNSIPMLIRAGLYKCYGIDNLVCKCLFGTL